ncbi:hypothetical protein KC345_g9452 [Hortaea werneckii]|nr:hypothetical protein KC345_g9452 [Hortaea werneckii]
MHASIRLLASLAAAARLAIADYGVQFSNALSTGPVAQSSFIREANTTLILPDGTSGCPAAGRGVWCIVASALETTQKMGEAVAAEPGSSVTFHYKYNDQTSQYDQTVSLNGEAVSRLSTSSGRAQGWGTAIECQQSACGTLTMDVADPRYIETLGTTGATGDMVTDDNGKTWTIDTVNIESYTYE